MKIIAIIVIIEKSVNMSIWMLLSLYKKVNTTHTLYEALKRKIEYLYEYKKHKNINGTQIL